MGQNAEEQRWHEVKSIEHADASDDLQHSAMQTPADCVS